MSKSIRIRTTPGDNSEKYVKIKLDQDFDFLELLSLKIDQKDIYQSFCSGYGVVAGRVIINNGFGVPNTKVSIFVPIDSIDINNQLISEVYPYETPHSDEKNATGIRYNLLPNTQQTLDHTPVGSFPTKREILDNKVTFEVYEKYYKYTTTTNQAGDFIIFGIPVGTHSLHYDMDLSDIGFLSARPYELIAAGYKKEDFESKYKFKSSSDLDDLPQILSGNISVIVDPFWCDDLSTGRVMGINRQDISIESVKLTPTAIFFGSLFSDDEKDSVNKNCRPSRKMGKMSEVITGGGTIEAIRRTIDGTIEEYVPDNSEIDDNGNWSVLVPMNMRKVVTDEFGALVPTNDPSQGVATESDIRFKISMDPGTNDERLRQRANFLVPNMTANYNFKEYSKKDLKSTTDWAINSQLSTFTIGTPYQNDLTNEFNYIEDFYTFRWKKVYTVKQYIGRYQPNRRDETRAFTGIKDIIAGEGVNKFPTNRMDADSHPLYWFCCFMLNLFGMIVGLLNSIINQINGLITFLCQIRIPCSLELCSSGCEKIDSYQIRVTRPSMNSCHYPLATTIKFTTGGAGTIPTSCGSSGLQPNKHYRTRLTFTGVPCVSAGVGNFMPGDADRDFHTGSGCCAGEAACWDGVKTQTPWVIKEKGSEVVCCAPSGTIDRTPSLDCLVNCPITLKGASTTSRLLYKSYVVKGSGNCGKPCPADCPDPPNGNAIRLNLGVVCFCIGVKIIQFCLFAGLFCKKCRSLCPGKDKFSCCDDDWNGTEGCTCTPADDDIKTGKCPKGSGLSNCIKKCKSSTCPKSPGSYRRQNDEKEVWCKIPREKRIAGPNSGPGFCDPRKCGCGQKGHDSPTDDAKGTATMVMGSDSIKCCNECCGKVPLIRLGCDEDSSFEPFAPIVLIPTIFAAAVCNKTYIVPWSCASCGGLETPYIKDWVACKLENLAGALNMLKFDFYNDWINGSLYFPLIKRKYNVKKRKKKLGQIKKDKFCDYDCDEFQGQKYCTAYYIKIKNKGQQFTIEEPIEGDMFCNAKIKRSYRYSTNFYGGYDDSLGGCVGPQTAQNEAAREISFDGIDTNDAPCKIQVKDFSHFLILLNQYSGFQIKIKSRKVGNKHGKPKYVETEDPATGMETWENIGGHSHHKNKCNSVYFHERGEYLKSVMDCKTRNEHTVTPQGFVYDLSADDPDFETEDEDGDVDMEDVNVTNVCDSSNKCDVYCGAEGVGACTLFCKSGCDNPNYNDKDIRHGLIKWADGNIFYVSKILNDDPEFNTVEYKANLFFPTDISELGSSTYCDIDEIPFIMDSLIPTTFQVSEDKLRVRTSTVAPSSDPNINNGQPFTPVDINSVKEKSTSSINLRAYVEFSCYATKCMNIFGGAVQSQLGVDIIDSNDMGLQTRTCFLRFEHDEAVRDYFCRRFSGFKVESDGDLNVNYMRPGSPQFDNTYKPYSEITVKDGDGTEPPIWYITPDGEYIESLYNGGDPFIPGDRCGLTTRNNLGIITNVDYFYALAPGQTPNLINFPNGSTEISDLSAANVDYITDDANGVQRGVKFNRSQTPYYFYFGLVPGSTALHKVVGDYFADKINKITLLGVGDDSDAIGNKNNAPPVGKEEQSVNQIFKTCLGETLTS